MVTRFLTCWIAALLAIAPPAAAEREVEIILDASGSMRGRLADGSVKLEVARVAVHRIANALPADLVVALRAYGHGSPREAHDCEDTELLVGFAPADAVRAAVIEAADGLEARGYTPIALSLERAAADFTTGGSEPSIVLVSDGLETCDRDPCAVARGFAGRLVVHTVGLGVDDATRGQLECIAAATGGTYFDARDAGSLVDVIGRALVAESQPVSEPSGAGFLTVEHADFRGHPVVDAASGDEVARVSAATSTIELPAGVYGVRFGPATWPSVEIRAGETTVISPGRLTVDGASYRGHRVVDSETGLEVGSVSASAAGLTLVPGTYDVLFGELAWPSIEVAAGGDVVLEAASIQVKGADIRGHRVLTADGLEVGRASATSSSVTVPPGRFVVELDGRRVEVEVAAGGSATIER